MQFTVQPGRDKISWTQDDRLEFKNGGSVEDLPGESGLLVTAPDGSQTQVKGWVDRDDQGQPVIYTRTYVAEQEEWMDWKQSFPEQGGMIMERLPERGEADRSVSIFESGRVSVLSAQDYGYDLNYNGRLDGKALVLQNDHRGEAVVPAVPFEWVLTR